MPAEAAPASQKGSVQVIGDEGHGAGEVEGGAQGSRWGADCVRVRHLGRGSGLCTRGGRLPFPALCFPPDELCELGGSGWPAFPLLHSIWEATLSLYPDELSVPLRPL